MTSRKLAQRAYSVNSKSNPLIKNPAFRSGSSDLSTLIKKVLQEIVVLKEHNKSPQTFREVEILVSKVRYELQRLPQIELQLFESKRKKIIEAEEETLSPQALPSEVLEDLLYEARIEAKYLAALESRLLKECLTTQDLLSCEELETLQKNALEEFKEKGIEYLRHQQSSWEPLILASQLCLFNCRYDLEPTDLQLGYLQETASLLALKYRHLEEAISTLEGNSENQPSEDKNLSLNYWYRSSLDTENFFFYFVEHGKAPSQEEELAFGEASLKEELDVIDEIYMFSYSLFFKNIKEPFSKAPSPNGTSSKEPYSESSPYESSCLLECVSQIIFFFTEAPLFPSSSIRIKEIASRMAQESLILRFLNQDEDPKLLFHRALYEVKRMSQLEEDLSQQNPKKSWLKIKTEALYLAAIESRLYEEQLSLLQHPLETDLQKKILPPEIIERIISSAKKEFHSLPKEIYTLSKWIEVPFSYSYYALASLVKMYQCRYGVMGTLLPSLKESYYLVTKGYLIYEQEQYKELLEVFPSLDTRIKREKEWSLLKGKLMPYIIYQETDKVWTYFLENKKLPSLTLRLQNSRQILKEIKEKFEFDSKIKYKKT